MLVFNRLKKLLSNPHIQIALPTGACIIIMAFVSKRVLSEPIGYLPLAIPPFIAAIYEAILDRYKDSRFCTTWYWIVAIFLATALVIIFNL